MKNKKSAVILVFNDQNKLALQLRTAHDDSYPLHWDFSAAGGIETEEDHKKAAIRELKEEIGIEGNLEYIGEELYQDSESIDQLYIYKIKHNEPFNLQIKEVQDEKFFTLDEIQRMITSDEKFHPEFIFIWNKGLIQKIV